jgi:hypothetical protein
MELLSTEIEKNPQSFQRLIDLNITPSQIIATAAKITLIGDVLLAFIAQKYYQHGLNGGASTNSSGKLISTGSWLTALGSLFITVGTEQVSWKSPTVVI